MNWIQTANIKDVPEDQGFYVEPEGIPVALFKAAGEVYAISNLCPHQGGEMAEGGIHGCLAMCPWHGWEFNVKTGECDFNAEIKIQTYPVKVENGLVFVQI